MKQPLIKQLLKPVLFLLLLIIVCAFLTRTLTSAETLTEHAGKSIGAGTDEAPVRESNTQDMDTQDTSAGITAGQNPDAQDTDIDMANGQSPDTQGISTEESYTDKAAHIDESKKEEKEDEPVGFTVYQEGFSYCELTDEIKERITGISYPLTAKESSAMAAPALNILAENETPAVSYDDLRYLIVLYYDFNAQVQNGELICHKGIAQDLAEIFYELYQNEYQIEKIKLIDDYQGDDTASMLDNNTSCFNYRVVDGTSSLSKHALGCAVDINPFYNPYVVFNKNGSGENYISPAGSEIYADRSKDFPYKIDENDLCYQLFKEHGFVWGGNWNSCKDYQHFQKNIE